MSATPESLQKFVTYCQQYLNGDEKGESQNFLDRFFQAFGHDGAIEAGAVFEKRVKKGGEDLSKHYAQAVTYWQKLLCPTYMILCNFDEFWIYNFKKRSSYK
jgi:hypothetical protein